MSIKIFGLDICPLELVTGDNGKLATTKIWTNIAYGIMSWIMYMLRPSVVTWEYVALFLAYGSVVGGSFIANKLLEMKFGANQPDPAPVTVNQPTVMNVSGDVKVKKGKK